MSILIPAYNAGPWIAQTIRSALDQTWSNKEIIVIDDGSTDKTAVIASKFAGESVIVVRQKNQGASATRNHAFRLCQGDYIQWLDADDVLAPNKIARQIAAAEKLASKAILLSGSWGTFLYRLSKAQFTPTPLWCDLSPVDWLVRKMGQNLHMQTATWLVSRELTEAAGPWDTRLSLDDDGEYFCRVLLASRRVHFVEGAAVFYRATGNSLSDVDPSNKKLESQFLSIQLHLGYLRSLEKSDRTDAACINYVQRRLRNFLPGRPDLVQRLHQLAAQCGGNLTIPELPWKYRWIAKLFGDRAGRRSQFLLPRVKWNVLRLVDKVICHFENNMRHLEHKIAI